MAHLKSFLDKKLKSIEEFSDSNFGELIKCLFAFLFFIVSICFSVKVVQWSLAAFKNETAKAQEVFEFERIRRSLITSGTYISSESDEIVIKGREFKEERGKESLSGTLSYNPGTSIAFLSYENGDQGWLSVQTDRYGNFLALGVVKEDISMYSYRIGNAQGSLQKSYIRKDLLKP